MIDWNAWSRIVEAAQDPQHREAVQRFLAQAELSAEIPAALDAKLLAPMRSSDATKEQCAYLLCNLGFAALVTGSRESANFAIACGQVAGGLAPDIPDLVLRRQFLSVKGALVLAVLTNQPYFSWDDVAAQCAGYFDVIDQYLETLPAESIENNAMAAYSFAGKALSMIADFRVIAYYDREVASLVAIALRLERRLPSALPGRVWNTVMPGTDARALFREVGAAAELSLCARGDSTSHSRKGLEYLDEILYEPADQRSPRPGRLMRTRAELFLRANRREDALEAARGLRSSPDAADRLRATLIESKLHLESGDPQSALELLARSSPSVELAIDAWIGRWMGDSTEGHWTDRSDAVPPLEDLREAWGLEAIAAAESEDAAGFLGAIDRFGGFLADSFLRDRQRWTERLRRPNVRLPTLPDRFAADRDVPAVEPLAALDEVFDALGEGTALLHVARTEECILTVAARRRGGDISFPVAPRVHTATRLRSTHKSWSRAHSDAFRHQVNGPDGEADCAAAFSGLLDEIGRSWRDVLEDLLEDDVTQLVLIGDDLVDFPLHAARIGTGGERLIDRVPVSYVPSLTALRACLHRNPEDALQRDASGLRCLADVDSQFKDIQALAAALRTEPVELAPPVSASFPEDAAASQVLHVVARIEHNTRMPFDSVLRVGAHSFSVAQLFAELDLPQCQVVSSFACETALPSLLRAPGLDLGAMFLAAGADHVLASSWKTRQELSSEMTQAFFEYRAAGRFPAAAFRRALLDLRSGRPSLPDYYWAGLRLVGAP